MRAWTLLVLVGCASDPSVPSPTVPPPPAPLPLPTPMPTPGSCTDVALTPVDSGQVASQSLPTSIDTQGVMLCLHLDASAIQRAHFMAGTPNESGASSSFESALVDAGGQVIVAGWDVSFGDSPPTSFANLEWSPPAGQTTDAKLIVWTRAGSTTTTLHVALFDPLE